MYGVGSDWLLKFNSMMHKVQQTFEGLLLFITIKWQPIIGALASLAAIWYYAAMLKINVIDVKHGGSWQAYFKSILKKKK